MSEERLSRYAILSERLSRLSLYRENPPLIRAVNKPKVEVYDVCMCPDIPANSNATLFQSLPLEANRSSAHL